MLRAMWTMEAQLKKFQRGIILTTRLETMHNDALPKIVAVFCLWTNFFGERDFNHNINSAVSL